MPIKLSRAQFINSFSPYYSETSSAFPYCTEPGLNFSTTNYSEDDGDFAAGRRGGKASRVSSIKFHCQTNSNVKPFPLQQDPLSHRIIEKRRRDRMNA